MNIIESFVRGFMKKAEAPNPAKGPVPQAKGEPAKAEPKGEKERPMKEAQKEVALKLLRDRKALKKEKGEKKEEKKEEKKDK